MGWKKDQAAEKEKQTSAEVGVLSPEPEKESSAAKTLGKTQDASKDQPKAPDAVTAMVEPEGEKGTVFVLDGSFLGRLREDLNKLLESK